MIDITTLTKADIGRKVWYKNNPDQLPELGSITSFNDKYVFVKYVPCTGSQATRPEDLTFVEE